MKKRLFVIASFFAILFQLSAFAQQKKIALLEPRVGDGSSIVSGMEKAMVRGELRKAIVNHNGFEAFTRADIDKLIAEHDFQRTGMVSDDQRRKVGEMSGADFICVSTLTKSNTEFYLEAYLINVESGQISNPASQYGELAGGKLANMLNICQQLAQEMIGSVTALTVPPAGGNTSGRRKQNVSEYEGCWVDLGLPSGTLWKCSFEDKQYDYYTALNKFGKQLPTREQHEELVDHCKWRLTDKGARAIGPNGRSLFLPYTSVGAHCQGGAGVSFWIYSSSTDCARVFSFYKGDNVPSKTGSGLSEYPNGVLLIKKP